LNPAPILVEVSYAEPLRAVVKTYRLVPPATVADVLQLAAADAAFSGVDIAHSQVGVFGRLVRRDQALGEGDRIEIYRPLAADPKSARRARAKGQARGR